jgi:hypothetical protein
MTDDLVERLRAEDPECGLRLSIATEAADRIEALENEKIKQEIEIMRLKRSVTKYHRQSLKDAAHIEELRQALFRHMRRNAEEDRAALGEKKDER